MSDPDSATSYSYDFLGRVKTASNAGTASVPAVVLGCGYDQTGDLTSRAETVGGQAGATVTYAVDNLGRVTREQQSGGAAPKRIDFAYDAAG